MSEKKYKYHPIIDEVLKLAYQTDKSIEFDDYAVEQIEDIIIKYSQKPDFFNAIEDLIKFAYFLDMEKSHIASSKIMKALENQIDLLKSLGGLKD
jgi:hypothetical protein